MKKQSERLIDALDTLSESTLQNVLSAKKSRKKILITRCIAAAASLVIIAGSMTLLYFTLFGSPKDAQNSAVPPTPITTTPQGTEVLTESFALARVTLPTEDTDYENIYTNFFEKDISSFTSRTTAAYFNNTEDNALFSPVNLYLSLSALAEMSEGQSRQQLLTLLGAQDIDELRSTAELLWNTHYYSRSNDTRNHLLISTGLFLADGNYDQATADNIARYYYADVFKGKFATPEYDALIQEWINEKTGGLLTEYSNEYQSSEAQVASLISTLYFKGMWSGNFDEKDNTEDIFHGKSEDRTATFMNKEDYLDFVSGDNYFAVRQKIQMNSAMWLILPDEGTECTELLNDPDFLAPFSLISDRTRNPYVCSRFKLSMPKFDISSSVDAKELVSSLGVTDIFDADTAELCISQQSGRDYVSHITQNLRVGVDEDGCFGVAYTDVGEATEGIMLPEEIPEEIILDRPFIFVITSPSGLPLFVGTVQNM